MIPSMDKMNKYLVGDEQECWQRFLTRDTKDKKAIYAKILQKHQEK